jgi:hypothetical protein
MTTTADGRVLQSIQVEAGTPDTTTAPPAVTTISEIAQLRRDHETLREAIPLMLIVTDRAALTVRCAHASHRCGGCWSGSGVRVSQRAPTAPPDVVSRCGARGGPPRNESF